MATNTRKTVLGAVAVSLAALAVAAGASSAAAAPSPSATTISSAVAADLTFSRDEERMARDLYASIAAQYDNALPFSNITVSEQRHYDAIGVLLTRYGVADPSAGKTAGQYADADVQKLYDSLLAQAKVSLTEAYKVGVAVEKRDIADLEDALDAAPPADVERVYRNLLRGSEMHLEAYTDATNGQVSTHATDGTGRAMGPGNAGTAGSDARRGMGQGDAGTAGSDARVGMGAGRGARGATTDGGAGRGVCVNP